MFAGCNWCGRRWRICFWKPSPAQRPRSRLLPAPLGVGPTLCGAGMIQTLALIVDAYRELHSKRLFWITLILSAAFIGGFALIGYNDEGLTLAGHQFEFPGAGEVLRAAVSAGRGRPLADLGGDDPGPGFHRGNFSRSAHQRHDRPVHRPAHEPAAALPARNISAV